MDWPPGPPALQPQLQPQLQPAYLRDEEEEVDESLGHGYEWQGFQQKRLRMRENVRKNLGWLGLFFHDLRTWVKLQSLRRRDPIFLWRGKIKKIEGQFGSGVASFFIFSRFLFLLNVVLSSFYGLLVILPMALAYDYSSTTETFSPQNLLDGRGLLGGLRFWENQCLQSERARREPYTTRCCYQALFFHFHPSRPFS